MPVTGYRVVQDPTEKAGERKLWAPAAQKRQEPLGGMKWRVAHAVNQQNMGLNGRKILNVSVRSTVHFKNLKQETFSADFSRSLRKNRKVP